MDEMNEETTLLSTLHQANAGKLTADADLCRSLLKFLSTHSDLGSKVAEIFATLARESSFRDVAKECNAITSLLPLLSFHENIDMRLQAMRAVGNLCIDHDSNRELVLCNGGCPLLIDQLSRCLDKSIEDGQSDRIKCITCGCILNIANDNEKLSKELLNLDVVKGLAHVASVPSQSWDVIHMALKALTVLLDYADIESLLASPLSSTLPHVLTQCVNEEQVVLDTALDIIGLLIENDGWKLHLVESGCIDQLFEVKDLDALRKVMDIIVVIVAEDNCLSILCKENIMISKVMEWISSYDLPLEIKASAALVVANIARNDSNCLQLVERGIVPPLISLTKRDEPKELFGKLHHSALSALRNLSIPSQNKPLFLQLGVVDVGLSLLMQSTQAHVQLKAFVLLRLLAEKQAITCSRILSEEGLIGRVCELCASVGPIHIQSEGSRLLAALVKYCKSPELMIKISTKESMKWICTLLESEHILMVIDGLFALSLLAALRNDTVLDAMMGADLSKKLHTIVSSHGTSLEVLNNAMTLIQELCLSDVTRSILSDSPELRKSLQQLQLRDCSDEMKRQLENVLQVTQPMPDS